MPYLPMNQTNNNRQHFKFPSRLLCPVQAQPNPKTWLLGTLLGPVQTAVLKVANVGAPVACCLLWLLLLIVARHGSPPQNPDQVL